MNHILKSTGVEICVPDIVRGEGCYLYDSKNNRYIDFESGVWCTALGHNHPRVNQALIRQMEQISHLGYRYTHSVVEEAATRLLEITQLPDGKCIFLSSGSEAVEMGVQIARRLRTQPLLLGLTGSYLAAYGSAGRRRQDEWYWFDWSACTACSQEDECDPQCPYLQKIPLESIGGFVFEPGNTSGQVKLPPKKVVQSLTKLIQRQQGLIMVDEVTTGFGRTGAWYGYEHYALKPDIIAMGKGLGNGYPVSAVVMKSDLAEQLESGGYLYAQSHQNDAWGCAIAKEVMDVIRDEGLIERSKEMGAFFVERLEMLKVKFSQIKEVRGRGLMIAVEFNRDDENFSLVSIHKELFRRGFLVGYSPVANLLRFYPPLKIKEEDIVSVVEELSRVLSGRA